MDQIRREEEDCSCKIESVKESCIRINRKIQCPQKTFIGINSLVNLRRSSKFSWTLISLIVIIILAYVLESTTVVSSPIKSKSRRDHHSHHHYHHHHIQHHRQSKHHGKHHRIPEIEQPAPDSSGSLSIVGPLDVLRQNMLMEMHKTRVRHAKNKIVESNREYLERIGR